MAQTWFYCGQRYYDRRWTWAAEPGASTCTSPARSPSGFAWRVTSGNTTSRRV